MKLAVIGGGASGISFIYSLYKKISLKYSNTDFKDIEVHIFDKDNFSTGGLAYSTDLESHILNMSLDTMSIDIEDKDHFKKWLNNSDQKERYSSYYVNEILQGNPPRKIIRSYLCDILKEIINHQNDSKLKIFTHSSEVINIERESDKYNLYCQDDVYENLAFDIVILALGNLSPVSPYSGLSVYKNYLNSPWPFSNIVDKSNNNAESTISIIGSSLTAIDIVLGLQQNNFLGKIKIFSRNGMLPTAQRSITIKPSENILSANEILSNIDDHTDINNKISLEKLIHLIGKDIEYIEGKSIDFKEIFDIRKNSSALENIDRDIHLAENSELKYQQYLLNATYVLPIIWNYLSDKDKSTFLNKYMSLWSVYRSPTPLINAKKIRQLIVNGILSIHKISTDNEPFFAENDELYLLDSDNFKHRSDYIINATGSTLNLNKTNNILIKNLIKQKIIEPHTLGGLHVMPKTSEVHVKGVIQRNLFCIGPITRGNFFYTNGFEANVAQAKELSDRVVNRIMRENNDESK